VFVVCALFVFGVIFASLSVLKPKKPPALPKAPVAHAALTQHLLFVIVDGLRYDVATDPQLMPRFSAAMKQHRSADILAGPVSMTSSAMQSIASGQRGRLEQIARNINPDPPPFQSWMQNARDRGVRVALVGDRGWADMYGNAFDEMRLDPPGVAIDYDYNEQTLRDGRAVLARAPNALILHFVTPDHQGHAYGVRSAKYRAHITSFDGLLFGLLAEVGPEWTVVVTSDHGANDAGDHGGDVLIQRRSPIFAYGPGIAAPVPVSPQLDQIDLAGTLSALIGVPAPCHSQGHVLVDWLALPDLQRAEIAANDVERVLRFAGSLDPGATRELVTRLHDARSLLAKDPARFVVEARVLARDADALLQSQQGVFSARAWWCLAGVTLGAALIAWLLVGPISPSLAVLCVLSALVSVALTATVERLPGAWPKLTPALLFGLFNLPTLLLLFKPEAFVVRLNGLRGNAAALVPGLLAVTYPRNLQPVAFAVSLIVPLVILSSGSLERWGIGVPGARRGRGLDLALFAVWGLALYPAGALPDGLPSMDLSRHTAVVLGAGIVLLGTLVLELMRRAPEHAKSIGLLGLAVVLSFVLRRFAPAWLGRPALVGLPLLAVWPLLRGHKVQAVLCLLAGYAWVSRDIELPTVAAALGLASLVGRRSAQLVRADTGKARLLTLLAYWFALAFVLRLGVSGGIDPTHLDLSAGSFGDRAVSAGWITFCIIWKNLLVFTLLGALLLASLEASLASKLACGFAVIFACRAALLLAMMQCSMGSFWTSMRVIGDLPYTMMLFVAAGAAWLVNRGSIRTASPI
jgi:hypothetical protein